MSAALADGVQRGREQTQIPQTLDRPHPVRCDGLGDVLRRRVQVDDDAGIELIGQGRDPGKGGIAQRAGCVQCEGGGDQGMILVFVAHRERPGQILRRRLRPGARRLGDRQSDHRPHALLARDAGGFVREIVAIPETGDACAQHLGNRREHAVTHEFGADDALLGSRSAGARPDKQRPGGMGGGIDHAGHQQMRRPLHHDGGRIARGRRLTRQQVQNTPVAHHQSVVFEDLAGHGHGHDPAGFDA
jgi:hypothetical protein